MSSATTMNDFSRRAVESFVQTVVFVDDKIYAPPPKGTVMEEKSVYAPKVRKPAVKNIEKPADVLEKKIDESELATPFSPHDIQASFAKKRIVCSLHQPQKASSVGNGSDTYKLCASADIVIVDWDLYGDDGIKASDLIENLVVQSLQEDPHQLRLVLIYTDKPNLTDVADKVSEKLLVKIPDGIEDKVADKGLAFHTLNARVAVLGKPATRGPEYQGFEVKEEDLASRATSEFCKLADGLLQGSVLMGLATIRSQSKKMLTKFHSGLDGAFLAHRALGLPHEEAFDHVVPLLVSEIEAALEDGLLKPIINQAIIEDWCKEKWVAGTHAKGFMPTDVPSEQFAKDLCTLGMDVSNKYSSVKNSQLKTTINGLQKDPPRWPSRDSEAFKSLASYFSANTDGNDLRELSILMSQRTFYGEDRHLTLGSIIRETTGMKRYLLCLQPVCDCVRLTGIVTFIFSALDVAVKEKATHVVKEGNEFVDLIYKPSMENCITIKFRPKRGIVLAQDSEFKSNTGKQKFKWVSQLKPTHAQRAAEEFARVLSRVGLTESEWLRLKAK